MRTSDVAVVGAGAFGAWTALCLAEAGAGVTLIDMFGPGNSRASSGGESRNIRCAYGSNGFYTAWARQAWKAWQAREAQFDTRLLFACGSLRAGAPAELAAQAELFAKLAAPFEMLSPAEVEHRWPQVRWSDQPAFYEPESGIVAAAQTMHAIERAFRARGGRVIRGQAALVGSGPALRLTVGSDLLACDRIVLACGPWLPRLLPAELGPLIRTPRRELLFVAPAPGDDRFGWANCPNLVDPLGWTSSDIGNGFKIAPPMPGIDMDPDHDDRLPTATALSGAKRFIAARLPGLRGRPMITSYVSQLENTASEDFIIDRHPQAGHVVIAGGGSGHAFKFGPLIGAYVAAMVLDGSDGKHAARFGLRAHRPLRAGEGG